MCYLSISINFVTQITVVIVEELNFDSTEQDCKTLLKALEKYERLTSPNAKIFLLIEAIADLKQTIHQANICIPRPDRNMSKTKRKGIVYESSNRSCCLTLKERLQNDKKLS